MSSLPADEIGNFYMNPELPPLYLPPAARNASMMVASPDTDHSSVSYETVSDDSTVNNEEPTIYNLLQDQQQLLLSIKAQLELTFYQQQSAYTPPASFQLPFPPGPLPLYDCTQSLVTHNAYGPQQPLCPDYEPTMGPWPIAGSGFVAPPISDQPVAPSPGPAPGPGPAVTLNSTAGVQSPVPYFVGTVTHMPTGESRLLNRNAAPFIPILFAAVPDHCRAPPTTPMSTSCNPYGYGVAQGYAHAPKTPFDSDEKAHVRVEPGHCSKCGGPYHNAANCHRWRREICRNYNRDGGCAYGQHCSFAHGVAMLNPFYRRQQAPNGGCFYCHGIGHLYHSCPERRCVECGSLGHKTKDCRAFEGLPKPTIDA